MRDRVKWAAWMKEYRKNNPQARATQRRAQAKYAKANGHKIRAHSKVGAAIRSGRLVRPDHCSKCGVKAFIEASHTDYARMLDVEWLCRLCHVEKDGLR